MLAALSSWLRHMVVLVLFAAVLDLVLPTSAMQRYVRMILGLVIVLSLLLPIRSLVVGVLSGQFETALAGPLVASWQRVAVNSGTAATATYSEEVRHVLQLTLSQGLPEGSLAVEVTTSTENDGSQTVNGILITCKNLDDYVFRQKTAQALQVQAAELLGLALDKVHVEYPGGEV